MPNLKKMWKEIVLCVVCAVIIILTSVFYSIFTTEHIFKESADHLQEIYYQLNERVGQQIESERSLLKSWQNYINNSMEIINDGGAYDEYYDPKGYTEDQKEAREKELTDFLLSQQKEWLFTDFFFIERPTSAKEEEDSVKPDLYKYEYRCKSGVTDEMFYASFRRPLRMLLLEDKGGVVGTVKNPDGSEKLVMLFAVLSDERQGDNRPTDIHYHYGSDDSGEAFSFASIGICFDTDKMIEMLAADVFGEQGELYMTLDDGTVLLQEGGVPKDNYFEYLASAGCKVSGKKVSDIVSDWTPDGEGKQKTSTVLINDGTEKYMTYMPIGFGDWMLVGVVPSKVVNSSMSWFRTVTIAVMASLFVLIIAAIAWMLFIVQKRRVKAKELEVKSRENLLDLLTINSNDLFVLFSPDTLTAEYVSANITRVIGLDAAAVRENVREIIKATVDKSPSLDAAGLKTLPVDGVWETDTEMENVQNGERYWFKVAIYHAIYNDVDSCVMMFSDRTKERKMNADLEDAFKIAKSANEAKSNFLSNMSHDIRTPMSAILGYATLLAKDAEKPDKVREYIRKIAFSGQHLLSLINDILDMSKIESGKTSLNMTDFSLPEFFEELYSMVIAQTKAKGHNFDIRTKGHIPEIVRGDKLRLNQILLNLLSNAVKYTPDGGEISLTVEALDKCVHNHAHLRIEVKDNGIGMSEQFVQTIFEPFTRETTAKTKEIQGTGLGMTITKNIVNLMGGTISVKSELGKGSTFIVELELAVSQNAEADEDFWKHNNMTNMLVVDDEEDICLDIRELMDGTGVNVDYALGGKQAVQMVCDACDKKEDYHIVLLDWKMPEMDGVETAKRIRKKVGREVPIMVLTSYSFEDIEEEAKAAGIDYFLSKPFFVSNFRNAIAEIRADGKKEDAPMNFDDHEISGLKVLAAEDNEINAEILVELLDIEGVECEIASNGKEALEKFESSESGRYDLIFMDVQMPVMNGYEATKAIRACSHPDAKTIPIIAMTANAFDDDVRTALDAGMNAHLAKPIDMVKLRKIVLEILGKK